MKRPPTPPIVHKLAKRADSRPERVNEIYRGMRPDYRDGPLNTMLVALCAVVAIGAVLLLTWGGVA